LSLLTFFEERLNLLYHLLHCGHHRFTIEKLELATAWIEREIPKNFTAKSIKILRQIYYARREEIKYEQGLSGGLQPMLETIVALILVRCRHYHQSLHTEAHCKDPKDTQDYHSNTDQRRAFTGSNRRSKISQGPNRGHEN
jgi:hypothetical protein